MKWFVCVLVTLAQTEAKPDLDLASVVARYIAAAEPIFPQEIKKAEDDVNHSKRLLASAKRDGEPERKRMATENLRAAEDYLKGLRNGSICPRVLIDVTDIKLGSVGTFYIQPFIFQVIDKQTVLARTSIASQSGRAPDDGPLLWVEGLPAADRADGTNFEDSLHIYYHIVGSKQYDTAIGVTKTVWVARAIDGKSFDEQVNKAWKESRLYQPRQKRKRANK